mmetsp:Transcript_29274/g.73660  ORF Transcript_29274/g.73660 Transcript_29274/m.73660 type:complete len:185 (+) Transcript_29274:225-779(+)|eukprot:CAMPEP_0177654032 /NCGR_PEP_ID=MMETSP0447-20121125/14078_1 /TAXON_ID=0 /ORGANISM="Stygamoeba regulata, Strain BSH-02190019" /LENGTH=184 /DNA_ID=CAMNT_0019157579 /DNA_START=141 /DNA_END=695 /DNA_ORIENTATION=+
MEGEPIDPVNLLYVILDRAEGIVPKSLNKLSNAYAKFSWRNDDDIRSIVHLESNDPIWDEAFYFGPVFAEDKLGVEIRDKKLVSLFGANSKALGSCTIPLKEFVEAGPGLHKKSFDLESKGDECGCLYLEFFIREVTDARVLGNLKNMQRGALQLASTNEVRMGLFNDVMNPEGRKSPRPYTGR